MWFNSQEFRSIICPSIRGNYSAKSWLLECKFTSVSLCECISLSFSSTSASLLVCIMGWIAQDTHVSKGSSCVLTLNGFSFHFTLNSELSLYSSCSPLATRTMKSHAFFLWQILWTKTELWKPRNMFFAKWEPISDLWIRGPGSVRRDALLINAVYGTTAESFPLPALAEINYTYRVPSHLSFCLEKW